MSVDGNMSTLEPAADPRDQQMCPAAPVDRLDTSSFGHWTQSGLMLLDGQRPFLARPLTIDGVIGQATRAAVRAFQRRVASFLPGARLSRTGNMDPQTTGALEQATDVRNPTGRPSASPFPEEAATAQGATPGPQSGESASTDVPVANQGQAEVEQQVRDEIARLPAEGPTSRDVKTAYDQIRASTLAKRGTGDKDAVRAEAAVAAGWEKLVKRAERTGKPLPNEVEWGDKEFFKHYWMLHCNKFANELAKLLNPGAPSVMSLYGQATRAHDAKAKAGEDGKVEMPGRDLRFRGWTMKRLAEESAAPDFGLEIGAGIHVKLCPEVDRPYSPHDNGKGGNRDDFHHWFVYVGHGKFADSFNANQSGEGCDLFMRNWMKRDFHQRGRKKGGEPFDYSHLHTPEFADTGSLAALAALEARLRAEGGNEATVERKLAKAAAQGQIPKPADHVMPLITAIYRPAEARGQP